MADLIAPRVKLPDAITRKAVVPGPNSWAQQQQQEQQEQQEQQRNNVIHQAGDARPTNRDRYEHKPMPPPPPSEESASHGSYILHPKAYIQPAIPLFKQPPNIQNQKDRAVTDPVAPKPLFAGRKVSVTQLRKKYSQSKGKGDSSKEGSVNDGESSPIVQNTSEKAFQVLGLHPVPDNSRNTPPSSAPVAPTADPFGNPHENSEEPAATPARHVQSSPVPTCSTPVPTRRYLRENGLPDPAAAESSRAPQEQNTERSQRVPDESGIGGERMPANRFLLPPRLGTHNNKGEVGLVQGHGMHRIESFRGVIEDGSISNGSNGQVYMNSCADALQSSTGPSQNTRDMPPNIYSPSDYGGVWENDPAVVSLRSSSLIVVLDLFSVGSYSPTFHSYVGRTIR